MPDIRYSTATAALESRRSRFKMPQNIKTTLNAGQLIPVGLYEVLPGDTISDKISAVCRELTLLNPVMDNQYLSIDAFFCPLRLVYSKLKQFFGENDTSAWTQLIEYQLPHAVYNLEADNNTNDVGTVGDYMGIGAFAQSNDQIFFNYLPLRVYAMIYNYWYLNENVQSPVLFSIDDNIEFGTKLKKGYNSQPLLVNRYLDLMTSCLPAPQKGPTVNFLSPLLPVHTTNDTEALNAILSTNTGEALKWRLAGATSSLVTQSGDLGVNAGNTVITSGTNSSTSKVAPGNLVADTTLTELTTINSLRIAIATQQYYERLARFGKNLYL